MDRVLAPAVLVLLACNGGKDEDPALPTLAELEKVVPGDTLPDDVHPQDSNNNLDVMKMDGSIFLAWRTSKTHFAGPETMLYVVRSDDGGATWVKETEIAQGTDLREPCFMNVDGTLRLYFATLGDNPLDFEPKGMQLTERNGPGDWTPPAFDYGETFIPWATHELDGTNVMLGYEGGGNIYDFEGDPIRVYFLREEAGELVPFEGDDPIVLEGGSSETDIAFTDDGTLVAISRNEAGDETGFGSKICTAPAGDPMTWTCSHDPKKYDSPLVFASEGRIWLVARRNLTETGEYDLGMDEIPLEDRALRYEIAYWTEPKRCSLWEVHPETRTVDFVLDLPSKGDTCFPAAIDEGDGRFRIYNYSNDPDGAEYTWQQGQFEPTEIDRMLLTIPPLEVE